MTDYYCSRCGITWRGSDGWVRNKSGALICTSCAKADHTLDADEWPMGKVANSGVLHPEYAKGHVTLFHGGQPGTGRKAR